MNSSEFSFSQWRLQMIKKLRARSSRNYVGMNTALCVADLHFLFANIIIVCALNLTTSLALEYYGTGNN